MIRLTKQGFRHWLIKNRKVIVGRPEEPKDCPFCRFLKSQGAKRVNIQIGHRIVDGGIHSHSAWQRNFQKKAIRRQKELDVIGLRGGEALYVLNSVT